MAPLEITEADSGQAPPEPLIYGLFTRSQDSCYSEVYIFDLSEVELLCLVPSIIIEPLAHEFIIGHVAPLVLVAHVNVIEHEDQMLVGIGLH